MGARPRIYEREATTHYFTYTKNQLSGKTQQQIRATRENSDYVLPLKNGRTLLINKQEEKCHLKMDLKILMCMQHIQNN